MNYIRTLLAVFAVVLISLPAFAQWQVPLNDVPLGRGGGAVGFSSAAGSAGTGNKCLNDTIPPSFGSCGPIFVVDGFTSAAIQSAINLAHIAGGGIVDARRCGTYVVTSTIMMYDHVTLQGGGFGCTIFSRSTNYGDTLVTSGAQAITIDGIWFLETGTVGAWTGSPSHIKITAGQNVRITNNWIWGLSHQLYVIGGTQIITRQNSFAVSGTHYGTDSILLEQDPVAGGVPTNLDISENYIASGFYTNGIVIKMAEVITIQSNYIGGYANDHIHLEPSYAAGLNPHLILSGVTIAQNFIDGSVNQPGGCAIGIVTNATGGGIIQLTISGNNFYGSNGPLHHICGDHSGPSPSVFGLAVTGNNFINSYGAPIFLSGAASFNITGNTFNGWNYGNVSASDPNYAAGIYLSGGSGLVSNGTVANNNFKAANGSWGVYTAGGIVDANGINLIGNEGTVNTAVVAGDVAGQKTMTSSTDKAIVRSSGAIGVLQGSLPTISDAGRIASTAVGGGDISSFFSSSAAPSYGWNLTSAAADAKLWDIQIQSPGMVWRTVNDANNSAVTYMQANRGAGTAVTNFEINVPLLLGVTATTRGQLLLAGTSGTQLTVQGPLAASGTLTLPAGTTDFSATGGTSQVVKQTSAGGAFTVARLACSDLSDSSSGCSASAGITALTGDATATGPGSVPVTFATVNSNVGTFGSSTAVPTITVNAKGLITAVTTAAPVVAAATGLTGTTLAANIVTSSLTALGTIAIGVWNAGAVTSSSTVTATSSMNAAVASGYQLGGAQALYSIAGLYTTLKSDASGDIEVGYTGDKNIYYSMDGHKFRTGATAAIASMTSAGLTLTALSSDTATTDTTLCARTSDNLVIKGTGALGICLGTSGAQFKIAFAPMIGGVDDIAKLNFQNYRYRKGFGDDGARMQYGLTAQDVDTVLPDLVRHDATGAAINFDSGALLFIGLRAIQQLNERVTTLESRR